MQRHERKNYQNTQPSQLSAQGAGAMAKKPSQLDHALERFKALIAEHLASTVYIKHIQVCRGYVQVDYDDTITGTGGSADIMFDPWHPHVAALILCSTHGTRTWQRSGL
jgi:hypothetical protein